MVESEGFTFSSTDQGMVNMVCQEWVNQAYYSWDYYRMVGSDSNATGWQDRQFDYNDYTPKVETEWVYNQDGSLTAKCAKVWVTFYGPDTNPLIEWQ